MPAGPLAGAVARLGDAVRPPDPRSDAVLVTAFVRTRDAAAASELVRRHGPMVLGVCRRLHPPEADDAFQAVWLVFSRKAAAVRPPGAVGAWLHGVAVKVATKARTQSSTRRRKLMAAAKPVHTTDPPPADPALRAVLDEELHALPDHLRRTVLLCDLGGKTRVQAAAELGWPEGTVAARLAKGRAVLAGRLRRRGVTLPAAGLAAVLAPDAVAVPPALQTAAVRLLLGGPAPPATLPLADAASPTMLPATVKLALLGLAAAVGLTVGGVGLAPPADPPDKPPAGDWELVATLTDHGQLVYAAGFAADGKQFATYGADGRVICRDTATLATLADFSAAVPKDALARPNGPPAALQFAHGLPWLMLFGTDWCDARTVPTPGAADPARERTRAGAAVPRQSLWPVTVNDRRSTVAAASPRVENMFAARRGDPERVQIQVGETDPFRAADPPAWGFAVARQPSAVLFSPTRDHLAVTEVSTDADPAKSVVRVVGASKQVGQTVAVLRSAGVIHHVCWSPDGKLVAAGGTGGLSVWDAATGVLQLRLPFNDKTVTAVRFAPDGHHLAVGIRNRVTGRAGAGVFPRDLKASQSLPGDTAEGVGDFAFSPDGNTLVAAVGDPTAPAGDPTARAKNGQVRVFRRRVQPPAPPAGEWVLKQVLKDHGQMVYDAAFGPDGNWFATAGADGTVFVRDTATLAVKHKLDVVKNLPPAGPAAPPPFDPLKPAGGLDPRPAGVNPPGISLSTRPDGRLRVGYTSPDNGAAVAWFDAAGKPLGDGPLVDRPQVFGNAAGWALFDPAEGREVLLDVPRRGAVPAFDGVFGGELSPAGTVVAVKLWDDTGTRVWVGDAATGKRRVERPVTKAGGSRPGPLAWSADGKRLAVAAGSQTVAVFAAPIWAEAFRHDDPQVKAIDAVTFTPDGTQLLVAGRREAVENGELVARRLLWVRDAATGEVKQSLPLGEGFPAAPFGGPLRAALLAGDQGIGRVAVAPDGRTLVVAVGSPGTSRVVRSAGEQAAKAATGEVRVYVRADAPAPKPAADPKPPAKPDPARAALGDATPLKDHRQMVYDAAFRPDGQQFASIGADGVVIVRDTASLEPASTFEVTKNLPPEPRELSAPLGNPPDLRVWWRADGFRGLRVRFRGAQGDEWAGFDPTGRRQMGGPLPAGATPHCDGERLILKAGDRYAVTRLTVGMLPVPLALAPKLVGLPAAAFTPDGSRLAALELHPDGSSRLRVLDPATGKALADRPAGGPGGPAPAAVAVSRDGKRVACALADGTLVVWDGDGWAERYRLAPDAVSRGGPVTALAFAADGTQVYDAGWHVQQDAVVFGLIPTGTTTGRSLRVRYAATGKVRMSTLTHLSHLKAGWTADPDRSPLIDRLVVSPDGNTLLAPQGSAARGSDAQTAAGQRAKATLAELLVYRRTAD